jgi:pimeloyl-ACP methyl ester carboxylesterase
MPGVSSPTKPSVRSAYGPQGRSPWLDIDWSAHQHWTIINDFAINVAEVGAGPALLFVHGLSGSWPNWLEQLPVFAAGRRAIALDLPGFGRSPLPSRDVSIGDYADTLASLLDALEIDTATVVGNSMGGHIAARLAIRHPHRVERLVLVAPAGLSTHQDRHIVRSLGTLSHMEHGLSAYGSWIAAHADTISRRPRLRDATFGLIVPHPGQLPAPLVAEQIRGTGKPGFVPALRAIVEDDLRPRLGEIACPTLIVWGDRDRVITMRDAQLFHELIPGSRKVLYEDTGHMAQLERPAEFNALLEEFLTA